MKSHGRSHGQGCDRSHDQGMMSKVMVKVISEVKDMVLGGGRGHVVVAEYTEFGEGRGHGAWWRVRTLSLW
ncbi:hypothetical protein Nepgr_015765 [Nepenthes gracilis]|uniref:Uncharacterized protein n=1 Tax=Nepenthes gracilis TaxID=150966 RepID=A0AAD3SNC4_NEPGR|nr:hypothetical protein Nepgr_015765 [Nepenthes gracilis]